MRKKFSISVRRCFKGQRRFLKQIEPVALVVYFDFPYRPIETNAMYIKNNINDNKLECYVFL